MPQINLPIPSEIIIELEDVEINNKKYKRKLFVVNMDYNLKDKKIAISGYINYYFPVIHPAITAIPQDLNANPPIIGQEGVPEYESYGNLANGTSKFVDKLVVSMTAANDDVCDMFTGEHICKISEIGNDLLPSSPCYNRAYMREFDWFFYVAEYKPLLVNEMIKKFFSYGASTGRFD